VILEDTIRQAETARVELRKVAGSTQGWADQQRQDFDRQRMKPLADAGDRLITALRKAQEQCAQAERLLSPR
jgi:signal transduction protein with GAF and PtsI domain